MIFSVVWLWLTLVGRPLAPISYPACLTDDPHDADLVAKEVITPKEANWCVVLVPDCKDALIVINRQNGAEQTYVVSATCQ